MVKEPFSLREEIRQNKPFASPAQEAMLALSRTTDVLQRRFAQLVEPHGISLQQYNVLRILRGADQEGTPKLEAKHLVRRKRCAEDRRQVLCWITEAGLRVLADLDKPAVDSAAQAMASLSVSEVRTLI